MWPHGSTLPGFMIPLGSNNALILFIHSMLVGLFEYWSAWVFITPIPCSADIEPLYDAGENSARQLQCKCKAITNRLVRRQTAQALLQSRVYMRRQQHSDAGYLEDRS